MNDKHEFEQLLRAHANRELTVDERAQLAALAAGEPGRQRTLAGFEDLHRLMGAEGQLASETMAPPRPSEEADESYRRLAQAAGRAEQQLQAKLMNPVHRVGGFLDRREGWRMPAAARKRRRLLWIGAAAAAAVLTAAFLTTILSDPGAPPLNPDRPDPRDQIGGQLPAISINPVLTASDPRLSWDHVLGARSYDAKILDAEDSVVLSRPEAQARSNEWRFTQAEYDVLKTHPGDLFLRVVARDVTGVGFTRSHHQKLDVR